MVVDGEEAVMKKAEDVEVEEQEVVEEVAKVGAAGLGALAQRSRRDHRRVLDAQLAARLEELVIPWRRK